LSDAQIIALGGGGFSEGDGPELDDFVLAASGKERPRICFVPTASGDSDTYITRFYRRFAGTACVPTHVELFRRGRENLSDLAAAQDVIYVGGGSTANMLAIWRLHGFDEALRKAARGGTVLAGISAGSICWFECGASDSFGPQLVRVDGLGMLPGSHCPHYDRGTAPAYHRLLREGMPGGIAADDGVALHFVGTRLVRVVTGRPNARACRVELRGDRVVETPLEAERL